MNTDQSPQPTSGEGVGGDTPRTDAAWDGYNKFDGSHDAPLSRFETSCALEREKTQLREALRELLNKPPVRTVIRMSMGPDVLAKLTALTAERREG